MKSNTSTQLFAAAVMAVFLAACSATTPDNKQAQLEKLKTEQAKIANEIAKLQEAIAKENPEAANASVKAKEVAVTEIAPRKFDQYIQTQGLIVAIDNIQVSAKTMGVINSVFVREGEEVAKGQTLAQIDNTLILRSIDELKSQLEMAKTVYDRQKNLWDQKIGTEVQYLQAKNNKESLENRLATVNEQLDMTKIKSPITGTIETVNIKIGENVGPGIPAFRVINTSKLKANAKISEAFVTTIKKGDKVNVTASDTGASIDAKVTFVGRNIEPLSRSFPIEIDLPSSSDLRPNMSVVVRVIFNTDPAALCVPVNIVQDINGEKVLYVAETEGNRTIARRRVVTIDGVYSSLAQVKSGLKVGDKVITVGYQGLNDGQFVKI